MVKKVDKIIDEVETGATFPLLGEIDENNVIIKTFGNRCGNKILVNEFVALKIAKILELPIPDGGLCIIDSETDMRELMMLEIEPESIKGIGFYSEKVEKCIEITEIDEELKDEISNLEDILKTIVFDHLIYNKDRHDGNMLLDITGNGNIYIIDHSHIFNLGKDWNKTRLEQLISDNDYKDSKIMESNLDLYELFINKNNYEEYINTINEFKEVIQNRLTESVFKEIIEELPNEWINDSEKEGVLNYLMYRLNNIDYMCDFIINYLNNPGGEMNENLVFDIKL